MASSARPPFIFAARLASSDFPYTRTRSEITLAIGAWCMPEVAVRKKLTAGEEIFHEGGPVAAPPRRRPGALPVVHNPYAGGYIADIAGFMDDLKPLGLEMAR